MDSKPRSTSPARYVPVPSPSVRRGGRTTVHRNSVARTRRTCSSASSSTARSRTQQGAHHLAGEADPLAVLADARADEGDVAVDARHRLRDPLAGVDVADDDRHRLVVDGERRRRAHERDDVVSALARLLHEGDAGPTACTEHCEFHAGTTVAEVVSL
jgi:hypothetical protein